MTSEEERVLRDRLHAFTLKVYTLVKQEAEESGTAGALLGLGAGLMFAQGATKDEIREVFEKSLATIQPMSPGGSS